MMLKIMVILVKKIYPKKYFMINYIEIREILMVEVYQKSILKKIMKLIIKSHIIIGKTNISIKLI